MTDDLKIDWLQAIQAQNEAFQQILEGVNLIMIGGPEGITEVANAQPETLLAAFHMLGRVLEDQQKMYLNLVEDYLEMTDVIDSLCEEKPK